jgi:CubicO group peptidase (beta-lactamase class C family)
MDWTEETNQKWGESNDPVKFFLEQPIVNKPGTQWRYNNGSAYLLSVIVARATGMDTLEYAKTRLFTPLGITRFEWPLDEHGNRPGHTGISMMPRDMAKFGYLYMMGGVWEGKQILDARYIKDSFGQYSHPSGSGYGYLWWTGNWFSAATGYMNQNITVSPRCRVVAVFTGWFDDYQRCPKLVGEYALRSIKSNHALPEDLSNSCRSFNRFVSDRENFLRC